MSNAPIPVQNLAQHIAKQEAELAKLRQELNSRQSNLAQRKVELQAKLQQVEAEIQAVSQGDVSKSRASPTAGAKKPHSVMPKTTEGKVTKPADAKPVAGKQPSSTKKTSSGKQVEAPGKQTLHEALTQVLAMSSRPLTVPELEDQLLARGYKSKSKDLKHMIGAKIGMMAGIERIPGQGYRLKKSKAAAIGKKG